MRRQERALTAGFVPFFLCVFFFTGSGGVQVVDRRSAHPQHSLFSEFSSLSSSALRRHCRDSNLQIAQREMLLAAVDVSVAGGARAGARPGHGDFDRADLREWANGD